MLILYDAGEMAFTSNGLVVLSDAISCIVTEEFNGMFECALEYPLDERGKWKYLLEDNIIKTDGQLFRIYKKTKTLTSIKINARHIFYDLLENILEDVRPTDISGYGALDWILTRTQYAHNFTSMGDVGGINTRYFIRKNPVDAIMGADGIIATWGGELVRDNFLIKLLGARGFDRGVLVAYGKNIQGIEETLDTSGICTRLMPLGKDGLLLTEKYIDSPYINNYPNPKIKVVEFSECETEATLRSTATAYMVNFKIDIPQFNYNINFLELSKTEEYKDYAVLESVYMADTATIKHSRLSIDLKAKVIKTTKNILTNRLEKVELGSFKPNFATGINNAIQEVRGEITNNNSFLELAIENATTLLTTALGGYVVKRNGELLIMDTENPMTATKVWRWNVNGLGYSSTGINGPYGLAMTMDGHIVANFVDTGVLNAGIIKAGILKSFNNLSWINMDIGTFDLAGKVTFDGTTFAVDGDTIDLSANTSVKLIVDDVKVGGRNLLSNGDFATLWASGGAGTINALEVDTFFGNVLKSTRVYVTGPYVPKGTIKAGDAVTVSFYAKGVNSTSASFRLTDAAVVRPISTTTSFSLTTAWVKIVKTFTALYDSDGTQLIILYPSGVDTNVLYITGIKIEQGNKATAWSPATNEMRSACFEVTDAHARFTATDGSYTEFVPALTGLTWHKGTTSKDYHYLSAVGTGFVNASATITITLPVEFKSKAFTVLVSLRTPYGAAYASSQDNAAGTFAVTNADSVNGCSFNYQATA